VDIEPAPPPGLIGVTAARQYLADRGLRISPMTARRWWDKGYVKPWISPSGQRRYDPADLRALVRKMAPPPDRRTPLPAAVKARKRRGRAA
jgi:predicted site-specific integrase-resolvase